VPQDQQGRIHVQADLSVAGYPNVFVTGDQANFQDPTGTPLPGLAPVALQQGRAAARNILADLAHQPRTPYLYHDKGMMATIGRSRAVAQFRNLTFTGLFAWLTWLLVHIYYLTGFRNRLSVVLQWGWSYLTFRRGARLITQRSWQLYKTDRPKAP
jgi:NADH dehydrogenase